MLPLFFLFNACNIMRALCNMLAFLCFIMWCIVLVSLPQQAYICRLKQLSAVQIINVNSATADLVSLLLAALNTGDIQ